MSMIQEVNAEQLAKLFCNYHEALAHDSCEQQDAGDQKPEASCWDRTPQNERKLMVAAARLTLLELSTTHVDSSPERKYYARPGEAEWGC